MSVLVPLVLFAHLLGVAALSGAITLEIVATARIRRATSTSQIRAAVAALTPASALFRISSMQLIGTGIVLMRLVGWDWRAPWLIAAYVLVFAIALIGPLVNRPRLLALGKAAEESTASIVDGECDARRRDPLLRCGSTFAIVATVALIALMAIKPVFSVAVAIALVPFLLAVIAAVADIPWGMFAARQAG